MILYGGAAFLAFLNFIFFSIKKTRNAIPPIVVGVLSWTKTETVHRNPLKSVVDHSQSLVFMVILVAVNVACIITLFVGDVDLENPHAVNTFISLWLFVGAVDTVDIRVESLQKLAATSEADSSTIASACPTGNKHAMLVTVGHCSDPLVIYRTPTVLYYCRDRSGGSGSHHAGLLSPHRIQFWTGEETG